MSLTHLRWVPLVMRPCTILSRKSSSKATTSDNALDLSDVSEVPVFLPPHQDTKELNRKRDKSRLNPQHRKILFGEKPYKKSMTFYHDTVKYKKRMLGRYGMAAVDAPLGIAWPTPEEVADTKEYERVAYPRTIQEEWETIRETNLAKERAIKEREAEVAAKIAKNEKWINDLKLKIEAKERALEEAKARREKILNEIKRELKIGYVNMQDEKTRELFQKKEKQYAKAMKEEKKKQKEEKKLQRMAKKQANEEAVKNTQSDEVTAKTSSSSEPEK